MESFTYPEVGATAGQLPSGYRHVQEARRVGHGVDDLETAAERLMTWRMHRLSGVVKTEGADRAEPGGEVSFRFGPIRLRCRVVYVIDEPLQRGFAYGTLKQHPECGEERFVVAMDPSTGEVWARVTAFSRPANVVVRLGDPVARRVQMLMTRRYLRALDVGGPGPRSR